MDSKKYEALILSSEQIRQKRLAIQRKNKPSFTPTFAFKYKQSVMLPVVLSVMLLLICLPFFWTQFVSQAITNLLEPIVILMLFSCPIWFYTTVLVLNNYNKERVISFENETLTFPESALSRKIVRSRIENISSPSLRRAPKGGRLILNFYINGKRYGFNNDSMSDKQFSLICNLLIQRSNRCKACQSSQVTWDGELGHCHNCETMTPRNSRNFDWSNAYQAN